MVPTMKRTGRGLLAALLCTAMLVTACGDDKPAATGSPGPVSLLVFGAPEELAAYRTLADAYKKANA